MQQQSGTCVNLVAGVTSADLLSAEPQLMTTQLEKAEMVEVVVVDEVVVDEDKEVETLTLVKESLLAELDVERDEMRRKLLANRTRVANQEFAADGSEEVLDDRWVEKVYKYKKENESDDQENDNTTERWDNNDLINAMEIKNRLLEVESSQDFLDLNLVKDSGEPSGEVGKGRTEGRVHAVLEHQVQAMGGKGP